jgi:hypothetical protein
MLTQSEFEFSDARVWGMGAIMSSVALAVAILIDLGRANILDKSNSTGVAYMLYFFMSTASIVFSTTGMIAVADFYASSEATDTAQGVAEAKKYMMANASYASMTMAELDKKAQKNEYDYKTIKGGGYPSSTYNRVRREIATEKMELKKYLNAEATVKGKRALQNTDDSSNWLFNTYARILESNTATAGLVIGLTMNFLAEAMALIAHMRLIKLNARLEVTEQQWSVATMVANEAMIVADSELATLNHLDHFAHTFKMPFNILNEYQNQGKRYGEFIHDAEWKEVRDSDCDGSASCDCDSCTNKKTSPSLTGDKQNDARVRYMVASNAKKGDTIECPTCIKSITKKAHNTIFCSGKGKDNCRDGYHNLMNPARIGARK